VSLVVVATLFSAFVVAVVVPGQDFVMVVRMSVSKSLRSGVGVAAGSATGLLLWGTASIIGVSALLGDDSGVSRALRIGGASVLAAYGLYSAVRAIGAKRSPAVDLAPRSVAEPRHPFARGWATGLFSNLTNAKLLVFFTSLFSGLLPSEVKVVEGAILLVAMGAFAFGWFSLIALLGSRPRVAAAYQRAGRGIDIVFGVVFIAIGAALLLAP
jgi:threonine efflux protein